MLRFSVKSYQYQSRTSSSSSHYDRNETPKSFLKVNFELTLEEARKLYPSHLRLAFSKLSQRELVSLSNLNTLKNDPNEMATDYIEIGERPLVDVLSLMRDWGVNLDRKIRVFASKDTFEKLHMDAPFMQDDDRIVIGNETQIFDDFDVWLDGEREKGKSLAFFYHVDAQTPEKRTIRNKGSVDKSATVSLSSPSPSPSPAGEAGRKHDGGGSFSLSSLWGGQKKNDDTSDNDDPSSEEIISSEASLPPIARNETESDTKELVLHIISDVFMPDVQTKVALLYIKRVVDTNGWHYALYVFAVTQGQVQWKVEKRYSQFSALHTQLTQQAALKDEERASDALDPAMIPKLTGKHSFERAYNARQLEERRKASLEAYLNKLLQLTALRPNYDLMCFLGAVGPGKIHRKYSIGSRGVVSGGSVSGNGIDGKDEHEGGHHSSSNQQGGAGEGDFSLHVAHLMAEAEIGDIILFQSKNHMSGLQRQATGSKWDHVGLVVRQPITKRMKHRILMKEKFKRLQAESRATDLLNSRSSSSRRNRTSPAKSPSGEDNSSHKEEEKEGGASDSSPSDSEDEDSGKKLRTSILSLGDKPDDIDHIPLYAFLERDLCLLEATGDGVTILPLAKRMQSYHNFDICHCMAVRKLRPLVPKGFDMDIDNEEGDGGDEKEEEEEIEHDIAQIKRMAAQYAGSDADDDVDTISTFSPSSQQQRQQQKELEIRESAWHIRATTLGLNLTLSPAEKAQHLENLNNFLISVENLPYGLKVGDLVGQKKKLGGDYNRESTSGSTSRRQSQNHSSDSPKRPSQTRRSSSTSGGRDSGNHADGATGLIASHARRERNSEAAEDTAQTQLLHQIAASSPRALAGTTLGDFCEKDEDGWAVYGRESVSSPSNGGDTSTNGKGQQQQDSGGGTTTLSAADLFPGLEQRTFFCSALVAAGLKALGVLSPDLNDNYFWPGAFAQDNEIDEEARQRDYCFTREVLIDLDTPAVAKLTHIDNSNPLLVETPCDDDTIDSAPGALFNLTLS